MSLASQHGRIVDLHTHLYPGGLGRDLHIPREAFRDQASLDAWPSAAVVSHLFKRAATGGDSAEDVDFVVSELDRFGIAHGQIAVNEAHAPALIDALEDLGGRVTFTVSVDPWQGMKAVRRLEDLVRRYPTIKSCSVSPLFRWPPLSPASREYYPIYAKCIELGIPVQTNVGFPGPRVPSATQDPIHLDDVCWFFPELIIVMRHGGVPWVETCIQLMLKWPNLYYATSGFAPKYYPQEIIHFANTRGSDRVMFAGYFPILTYEEIFDQLSALPLRDRVWPKFLGDNARRVYGIG